ncbi:hypothetical protein [Streptomyces cupreus]|uniref:Uncharacterized protein n=1 Tax=Streptomyces cupreus TaxID=2759956 RepID=A0A7X1J5Y3_9ACTN|nr:hypothetical protein [Streptomyces cupreus]MBC2904828.1 hypothetical protein [Streptomyces cupreus]
MTAAPAAVPLVYQLVDDAGLFPPEALSMAAATARHRRDRAVRHPALTHRFLCPADRLPELVDTLGPEDHFRLGLITRLDAATLRGVLPRLTADPRIQLAGVEGPLPSGTDHPRAAAQRALAALREIPAQVPGYVEVPLTEDRPSMRAVLSVLADGGRAAKVRCGGIHAVLFPSSAWLGAFVHACATAGVPFKATVGLHQAVRHRDQRTGFTHHGFLNLLLAVCRVVDGGTVDDAVAALESTDAQALAAEAHQLSPGTADAARALFVAYGSCSTSEPLDDLRALGLAEGEGAV